VIERNVKGENRSLSGGSHVSRKIKREKSLKRGRLARFVGRAYLPDMVSFLRAKARFQAPNVGQVCPTYGPARP
jgi:hypothetical protein